MNYRVRKLWFVSYNLVGSVFEALGFSAFWYRRQLRRFAEVGGRKKSILVLCHGNICRSPYVELLLRKSLDASAFEIRSAGLRTTSGKPADASALRVAEGHDIDLSAHSTKQIEKEELGGADLILVMDPTHLRYLKEMGASALQRTVLFGAFSLGAGFSMVISDPYGKPDEAFQECYRHLNAASASFLSLLSAPEK